MRALISKLYEQRNQMITHKCLASRRRSKPGALSVETGIVPLNWFPAKSSQKSWDNLPREGGRLPTK